MRLDEKQLSENEQLLDIGKLSKTKANTELEDVQLPTYQTRKLCWIPRSFIMDPGRIISHCNLEVKMN